MNKINFHTFIVRIIGSRKGGNRDTHTHIILLLCQHRLIQLIFHFLVSILKYFSWFAFRFFGIRIPKTHTHNQKSICYSIKAS